ncbi:L-amino-acid oxidase [Liparis tanakae]|uniref:L-amino-acid oxidase n=1 Tax=Liparis tanakae TaxID=230148 RepID=A0A4Z2EE91_9TELE|nr:L-amino-acid oxidase [Liparis tanakae]
MPPWAVGAGGVEVWRTSAEQLHTDPGPSPDPGSSPDPGPLQTRALSRPLSRPGLFSRPGPSPDPSPDRALPPAMRGLRTTYQTLPLTQLNLLRMRLKDSSRNGASDGNTSGPRSAVLKMIARSFALVLVGVVLVSVGGLLGDPLSDCLQDDDYSELLAIAAGGLAASRTPRHVAVIGGGVAGLTAAKVLEDAGHKVTILEASGRIGGRVETARNLAEGWYAEVGAMRIPSFNRWAGGPG